MLVHVEIGAVIWFYVRGKWRHYILLISDEVDNVFKTGLRRLVHTANTTNQSQSS